MEHVHTATCDRQKNSTASIKTMQGDTHKIDNDNISTQKANMHRDGLDNDKTTKHINIITRQNKQAKAKTAARKQCSTNPQHTLPLRSPQNSLPLKPRIASKHNHAHVRQQQHKHIPHHEWPRADPNTWPPMCAPR